NIVFLLYGLAIAAMFIAGVVYLAKGNHAATNPWNFSTWRPSNAHGLNFTNWTFFGLAVLALLGVEVPLNMGVEIREQRSIPRCLLWGSAVVVVASLPATRGVMVPVPTANSASASITAVAAAVGIGLGSVAGKITALVLALFFLFITVVYNYSFARLIFVSG